MFTVFFSELTPGRRRGGCGKRRGRKGEGKKREVQGSAQGAHAAVGRAEPGPLVGKRCES